MTQELQNKRLSGRRRMLKQARMSFNGGRSTIDCVLRNLSDTGALLKVTSPLGVPDRFELVLLTEERVLPCRVVRRAAEEIGVAFDDGKE